MEELESELKKYPSSFEVFEYLPTSKTDVKKIKDKLLLELQSEEYDTDIEFRRTCNLISFLCFVLKDFTEAESYTEEVLKRDPDNMISLSNKTWFSIKNCSLSQQCTDNCNKLESLMVNRFACLVAKAEIAFTFSRLGVKGYDRAKSLYKDVIEECEEIMTAETIKNRNIPTDYLCVWMFGYALVQRRLMNVCNTQNENELDQSCDNLRHVIDIFCRIIKLKDPSECVKRYQARSYVELGHISFSEQDKLQGNIREIYPDDVDLPKTTEEYYTTALQIFPNDVYILEKSGQYYRYARKIELSIQLLENAIEIKGTSHAYHHLASSLRRKLDIDVGNVVYKPFKAQCKRSSNKARATMVPVKSPLQPKPINYEANKDAADKILGYFNMSVKKAFNTAAMYDQALFYRQLDMIEKALELFEQLIKNEDDHSSRVDLANAFEQAGLCLQQMLNQQPGDDQRKDMEEKMKMYWKSSIEISCNLISKIPSLNKSWKSTFALRSIIGNANTKEDKQDLLFLYNKMEQYKEALEVLNELEKLAETQGENSKIVKGKVEKYLSLGMYDDVVIALSTLPNVLDTIGKKLCMQIYVEAGIDALKKGYDGKARDRIRRAFEVLSSDRTNGCKERYDLFILCNMDDEENGQKLLKIINSFGLHATFNTERLRPGTSMLAGMTNEMKNSDHFVIVFDFDARNVSVANRMQHLTERLQLIVEAREAGSSSIMVVKAKTCEQLPDMFLGYKTIDMDLHTVPEDFTEDRNASKAVKEILLTLLLTS
ncbi:uncharacterized protein LOC123529233 [Mercenaria mercenaria]|uniref:uncharacterized protein LOC123529233 n=1 Tax=Mercenaria mercenaria TaxID=6596 RepID=UPI00234E6E5A|nr:uncharacterized protein LOC123529233 [Mercenaria mercenaria]